MFLKRLLASLILSSFFMSYVVAQTTQTTQTTPTQTPQTSQQRTDSSVADDQPQPLSPEELKKKALALLDEIIKDVDALKIPENRVHFKVSAADLLWDSNEQRARALFKEAVAEFTQLSSIAQTDDDSTSINIMPPGTSTALLRREILFHMARHDASSARSFLRATHPTVENSLVQAVEPEENLELNLAAMISRQDPQQALEMSEESLKKGYKPALNGVLKSLAERDRESATKLAEEIFNKLKSDNLATNREAFDFAVILLLAQAGQQESALTQTATLAGSNSYGVTYSTSNSNQTNAQSSGNAAQPAKTEPVFTKQQLHDISEMLIAAAMSKGRNNSTLAFMSLNSVMSQLQEYAPERLAQLNARVEQQQRAQQRRRPVSDEDEDEDVDVQTSEVTQDDMGQMAKYAQIARSGSINEVRDALKTAPQNMRFYILSSVIDRAVAQGQGEQVRQLINENITDPSQRNNLLASLDQRLLTKATNEGRIEEARRLLGTIRNPERRALALAQLAGMAMATNNKQLAANLLDEARNLVNYRAKNFMQLGAQMEVARTFALVNPSRSLSMLEPIVDQLNELISAGSVIGGFISEEFVRDDEIVMLEPIGELVGMFSAQYGRELNALSTGDFVRTKALADRFQRPEVRLLARMLIARSVLAPQSMFEGRPGGSILGGPRY